LRVTEQARQEAERRAEQQREQELAAKQSEIELAEQKAKEEAERALAAEQARLQAETEVERLKIEAEQARLELEKQLNADIKRSEIEHQVAQARAEELVNKQTEIDEIARVAEQASLRAMAAEEARLNAEQEIERLIAEIEQARKSHDINVKQVSKQQFELEEAELKRKQKEILEIGKVLEQEARRVQAAEAAQIQAQEEIARLRTEVDILTRQAQQQLSEDVQHAAEKNAAVRQQAEELARKQRQLESATQQAQHDAQRAKDAIEARNSVEVEIERLKAQSQWAINQAKELVRRTKVEAKEQVEREIKQARVEAAATSQAEAKEAARKAKLEAKRAEAAEKARKAAEREIERLKVAAEVQRIKAENAIRDSIKAANRPAAIRTRAPAQVAKLQGPIDLEQPLTPEDSFSSGVDIFNYEPPNDLEVQDDMSLLFTNIDVGSNQPRGATDLIKAISKEQKSMQDDDDNKDDQPTSAWVSDQVMWEATLGIREDEKAKKIIEPKKKDDKPSGFFTFGNQQAPETTTIGRHVKRAEVETQPDSTRSVFKGRELNPNLRRSIDISTLPRRQFANWRKKVKVVLWLSPLIVGFGYYMSLSEQQQVDLQLKLANSVKGMFASSDKDISSKAEKLIKETEARLNSKEQSAIRSTVDDSASDKTSHDVAIRQQRETSIRHTKTIREKNSPRNEERLQNSKTMVQPIPAPEPTAQMNSYNAQGAQPTLPPLPDVKASLNSQTTSTIPAANDAQSENSNVVDQEQHRSTSGRTSIGVLPPTTPVRQTGDVNAEQNTATFHSESNGNLETPIAK